MRKRAISILGGRAGNAGSGTLALAEAVGAELARRGYGVVSGGDGGVAEAANRGCRAAGGETLALLKWNRLDDCGPEITWSLPTSLDLARSNVLNWAGDGAIAFEGRYGTLGEIALALDTARPLIVLGEQPFLDPRALDAPNCRAFPDPQPGDAAEIVDALEALIAAVTPPPVRPGAALFHSDLAAERGVGLRRAVPEDLALFRQAFTDPAVQEWWDLPATDEALARFQHERCLVITEAGRPVGFLEYRADTAPGADHLELDLVVAAPQDRGRGIGSAALTRFAAAAFAAGHHRITAMSGPSDTRATRCFERSGFRRVGVLRSYRHHQDALLFELVADDLTVSQVDDASAQRRSPERLALDLAVRREVFGDAASIQVPDQDVAAWREFAEFLRCGRPIEVTGGAQWPAYPKPDKGPALWYSAGVESTYVKAVLEEQGIKPTLLDIADFDLFKGPDRRIGQVHFLCASIAASLGYGPIYLGMERADLMLGASEFMRGYTERHPYFADWWSRYQPEHQVITLVGGMHKEEIISWLHERGIGVTGTCDNAIPGRAWCGDCYKCFEAFYTAKPVGIDLGIPLTRAAFDRYHVEYRRFVDSEFTDNYNNAYQHYVRLQITYGPIFDPDVDCQDDAS
ncbi:GNAT family N-acetyltransferase [Kitasatospora viridis]|uniref:Uncharacterized protein (TIGR00725 family) n=1 Tax=Kitasatospora viridis TaxID=281105 RepID=A0A561TST9_9ACTN|nr:GNAT family N-acetyltransferase [Kitasatospora viridis]TWF90172.1 uncharacterized protein (TIGR00725 family) [Kitasatospora viridis]